MGRHVKYVLAMAYEDVGRQWDLPRLLLLTACCGSLHEERSLGMGVGGDVQVLRVPSWLDAGPWARMWCECGAAPAAICTRVWKMGGNL